MGYEELVTGAVAERVAAESDRLLRAALSTERCDRAAAEAAVAEAYRAHGMAVPRTAVWMESPLGGALASWVVRHGREDRLDGTLLGDAVAGPPISAPPEFARRADALLRRQAPAAGKERRAVGHAFVDFADAQARLVDALGFPMYDQLDFYWDQDVHGAYELEQEMTKRFGSSPHPPLTRFALAVHHDLLGRVRGPVPERIVRPEQDGDVITPPPPPSREEIYFYEEFGGGLDCWGSAWELIRWRCMLAAAGLPASPALETAQEVLYRVGRWWPLEDVVVLCERPVELRFEDTLLIGYADGYRVAGG
ncbi:DUF6745 domain-containing protein [Streptomyces sp. NPDC002491]